MALTEQQLNPWRAIVSGGDYNLSSQDWEDLLTELDSLYAAPPASEQKPVAYLVSIEGEPELGHWFAETNTAVPGVLYKPLYLAPQPDYKAQRDAERYRWLRDHNKSWSWNPSQYNKEIISGFAAFNADYLGFEFESAMEAAIASVKGGA